MRILTLQDTAFDMNELPDEVDDVDFDATNPGVWCHSVHSLQNRNTFTPWSKYTKDETL